MTKAMRKFALFLLRNSSKFVIAIPILLLISFLSILITTDKSWWEATLAVFHIFMGDGYSDYVDSSVWFTVISLTTLRFLGWFIIPIIVSVVIESGIKEDEMVERIRRSLDS